MKCLLNRVIFLVNNYLRLILGHVIDVVVCDVHIRTSILVRFMVRLVDQLELLSYSVN